MPLLVVVNASPLIGLAKGARVRLLEALYGEVLIPPSICRLGLSGATHQFGCVSRFIASRRRAADSRAIDEKREQSGEAAARDRPRAKRWSLFLNKISGNILR